MHASFLNHLVRRVQPVVGMLALAGLGPALPLATGVLATPAPAVAQEAAGDDVIVFTNGKKITGKITEETATTVTIRFSTSGIPATVTYQKSELLSITKGTGKTEPAPATPTKAGEPARATPKNDMRASTDPTDPNKKKVYKLELNGVFGEDISQTPMRQAIQDARKLDADYIIVVLDNDWSLRRFGQMGEIKDDQSGFEQFWRVEDMDPVLTEEIERQWTKKPTVVFWIKKAMGGAAFLPLSCPNIYFHSEGKMGGIGQVEETVKSGDEVVRQKLIGARLGHVRGMAVKGGYDPRIVLAMTLTDYVLSYRMSGGKPEFLERAPASPDEEPLTDDGKEGNKDNNEALARAEGNDCLTLKADIAFTLGISKGTVDSYDHLMQKLGLSRDGIQLNGKADQLMKAWKTGLGSAKRQLPKLWEQVGDVAVKDPGGYPERTAARNRRKALINEMQGIEKKYEEALNPRAIGVPGWADLETMKKEIELQQLQDKPDRR